MWASVVAGLVPALCWATATTAQCPSLCFQGHLRLVLYVKDDAGDAPTPFPPSWCTGKPCSSSHWNDMTLRAHQLPEQTNWHNQSRCEEEGKPHQDLQILSPALFASLAICSAQPSPRLSLLGRFGLAVKAESTLTDTPTPEALTSCPHGQEPKTVELEYLLSRAHCA